MQPWPFLESSSVSSRISGGKEGPQISRSARSVRSYTYERTKRSLFNQSGFLGLNLMNSLKRTWAMGAMPLEAELAYTAS